MTQKPGMKRREFLSTGAVAALAPATAVNPTRPETAAVPADDRAYWLDVARRLADPVLTNLAAGTLKARMPVEQAEGAARDNVSHLEALGRLLAGLSPWLELPAEETPEGRQRARLLDLARRGLAMAVDPASPDFMNFTTGGQPLVDAAFLGQALLRAPRALRESLTADTKKNLVRAFEATRVIPPAYSNWLLFTATVEAALFALGASWDRVRIDYALRQHAQWYKGDGVYGDGPDFHFDYYNSYVILPMLVDLLAACGRELPAWEAMREPVGARAKRHAAIQERLISPEGTFPPVGRSIAYRFGALHLLAQSALRKDLPDGVSPAQVRAALTAVIRRSIEAPGTFDAAGFLRIGFCGAQAGIGERYISTGSLYLCSFGLLPLGLPATDPFWALPAEAWTAKKAWTGQPFPIDKALSG